MTQPIGLVERLTREIVTTIRSQDLRPGQPLPSARALAERFEVTVPTVREALRRLEATGSVELKHGSGTYVREAINRRILDNPHYVPVDLAAAIELLDARIAIEPGIAELAASVQGEESVQTMETAVDNALQLHTEVPAGHFHVELAKASGNRALHEMLVSLLAIHSRTQQAARFTYDRLRDHDEHADILDAVKRGDGLEASHRTRKHLESIKAAVLADWSERADTEETTAAEVVAPAKAVAPAEPTTIDGHEQ
ncbi:FCD domain-containing protein [Brevibacterium sandarakinum]|uniref:FCD domain-containing protein n=1 Tax=Brevibacterium sandarakinum TaxID=629680 RepID=A0A1H1RHE6_BRESA|nr:GntR family transcriptional regulator [Brevibacterium sandarakinum]SDS35161.1 FCD domain-containing protein [Brevibacterium sandarakinum]